MHNASTTITTRRTWADYRPFRRQLSELRRRRRLRVEDVTIVEPAALRKAVTGSVVGNIMEWYDVGVYGYLAVILGQVFLPGAAQSTQNLFSLAVFAATFIARPLGGVILGQLGDRMGRKNVLAFTLTMMALATFLIGCLPTPAAIGAGAPILLVTLKLIQGFSTGGEYAGATTFVTEYAPDKRRGFLAALLDWGSYIGFALGAAFVSILQLTLSEATMSSWGWRIPFLVALPIGGIALYFRTHIEDTPAFTRAQDNSEKDNSGKNGSEKPPSLAGVNEAITATDTGPLGLKDLVKRFWRELLIVFVLVSSANTMGYTITSYMPTYLSTTLNYSAAHGNLLTVPILVFLSFCIPLMGWLSDRIGRRTITFTATIWGIVLSVPAFLLLQHGQVWSTILGLLFIGLPVSMFVPCLASAGPAMFPTHSRYGGMGVAYNAAIAIFGGTAGLIMEALVTSTGNNLAPAFWLAGMSLAGLIAAFGLRESARRPMPGSMPSVTSEEEAHALVETQSDNADLDVEELFSQAPAHVVAVEPATPEEAHREVLAAEQHALEAQEALRRARDALADAKEAEQRAIERAAWDEDDGEPDVRAS